MRKGSFELYFGSVLVLLILLLALVSVFYTPYGINAIDTASRSCPPSLAHLAGTDSLGRDIFSRLMTGARFTILVAVSTVALSSLAGSILGLTSGYFGGVADEIIMRVVDALTSFPGILIALVVVTVLDWGKLTIIVALVIMFTPSFTRIVRVGTLKYRETDFVQRCRVYGCSVPRILFLHVYPNVFPLLFPSIIVGLSNAILAESSMSYLGLGIQPPTPSWGWMLSEAQNLVFKSPWYAASTGAVIVLAVVGFNCLGEGLRKLTGAGV
ncbi:MAG: ABC transporter permease [Treponema sp.]|nr:ABC transporter permease [Treponema sp.]MBQ6568203.1 ABC transporter permease [Treponema sp.]MBQ7166914.1 ABC transporter permease [Treponema sp.]